MKPLDVERGEIRLMVATIAMHAMIGRKDFSPYQITYDAFEYADAMLAHVEKEIATPPVPDPIANSGDDIPW